MGKFFHRLANRAVKAVGFGIITQVGEVDGQRLPLLKRIIRVKTNEMSEAELKADILRQVPYNLAEREVFVIDGGVLRLWNGQTGELEHLIVADDQDLLEPRGVLTLNFIEDGTLLLAGGADNTARFWREETGQLLVELGPHLCGVLAAELSPDGAKVATATTNGIVRLWDTQSGNLIDTMRGHAAEVLTIDFNADGTLLVTASNDGMARLWPIFPGTIRQMLTEAARRANRPFTEAECEQYFADTLAVCLGGSP
ncbi:MAG: hypothetical protein AMJ56_11355 [Anaerolineae bacterium SG8_19]|nr:MAG: hypothetical protein AMJ56_11355 [Anaerolineae bacterium SG8_19]